MGGRGTYSAGMQAAFTYKTIGRVHGIKILQGMDGKHGLPEEAHSSYAYASLNHDGTVRTLRFYDKGHNLRFEIAYHGERSLDASNKPVLHYHVYNPNVHGKEWHTGAIKATKAMRKRYGKYFKGVWK